MSYTEILLIVNEASTELSITKYILEYQISTGNSSFSQIAVHLFIYLFIHSFIHLFIYLFIHLFIYLFIFFFICLFIFLYNSLLILFFVRVFSHWLIHLFMDQFINLFIYLFMYLLTHLFSGLAIKCYTGTKIVNLPSSSASPYAVEKCAPGFNACVTVEFTAKQTFDGLSITIQTISGSCIFASPMHPALCKSYCNALMKAQSPYISSCTVSNTKINLF